jgi:hypothetical protein
MTPLDDQTSQRVLQLSGRISREGVKEIYSRSRPPLRTARGKRLIVGGRPAFLFAAGIVEKPEKHSFRHLMHFIIQEEREETVAGPRLRIYPACYRNDTTGTWQESATIKGTSVVAGDKYLQVIHAQIARDWLEYLQTKGYIS